MSLNITAGTGTDVAAHADGIEIQVNKALTGTIGVTTGGSTLYGTSTGTVGTITNPAAGDRYRYRGLRTQGTVTVTPSTTCDITVSMLGPGV